MSALLRDIYPKGAVNEAIEALELSYSYLRENAVVEEKLRWALHLLYRARELSEGIPERELAATNDGEREGAGR